MPRNPDRLGCDSRAALSSLLILGTKPIGTLAPYSTSNSTTSRCPSSAAQERAARPKPSDLLALAPDCNSLCTTSLWPEPEAQESGVRPSESGKSTSAHFCSRVETFFWSPNIDALTKGVNPARPWELIRAHIARFQNSSFNWWFTWAKEIKSLLDDRWNAISHFISGGKCVNPIEAAISMLT